MNRICKILIRVLFITCLIIPLNAEDNQGSITIKANQDNVEVYLNNKLFGVASGPSTISDLSPGNYNIIVKKKGFQDWEKNVKIKTDENIELKINSKKIVPKKNLIKNNQVKSTFPTGSFLLSVLFPGLGQLNQGYTLKGVLFVGGGLFFSAIGISDYIRGNAAYNDYKNSTSISDANYHRELTEGRDKTVYTCQIGYLCVWSINIIDMLIWSRESDDEPKVTAYIKKTKDDETIYTACINFRFK